MGLVVSWLVVSFLMGKKIIQSSEDIPLILFAILLWPLSIPLVIFGIVIAAIWFLLTALLIKTAKIIWIEDDHFDSENVK